MKQTVSRTVSSTTNKQASKATKPKKKGAGRRTAAQPSGRIAVSAPGTVTTSTSLPVSDPMTIRGQVKPKGTQAVEGPVSISLSVTFADALTPTRVTNPPDPGRFQRTAITRAKISQPDVTVITGPGTSGGGSSSQTGGRGPTTGGPSGPSFDPPDIDLPPPPVDPDTSPIAVHHAEITSGVNGVFEYSFDLPNEVLSTPQVHCTVQLQAYVPGAHLRKVEASVIGTRPGDLVSRLNAAFDDITYKIDFDEIDRRGVLIQLNNDPDTLAALVDMPLELALHYQAGNPIILPGGIPIRVAAYSDDEVPLRHLTDDKLQGEAYPRSDELSVGEYHYEVREEGTTRCILRTPPLSGRDLADAVWGFVQKLNIDVGVGSLNAGLEDRYFRFPFIVKNLDLDVSGSNIRLRGDVGVGTGKNAVLFTVASLDCLVRLSPRNFHNMAFQEIEMANLFDVSVASLTVDAAPGTDLDEMPWWAWAALGIVAPGAMTWAAVINAIEAMATPIVTTVVEDQVATSLGTRAAAAKEEEFERLEEDLGDVGEETLQALREGFWFELDRISFNPDVIHLDAFAGVWVTHAVAGTFLSIYLSEQS